MGSVGPSQRTDVFALPKRADVVRKACVVGAVLAGALVFFLLLTVLCGPVSWAHDMPASTRVTPVKTGGGGSRDRPDEDKPEPTKPNGSQSKPGGAPSSAAGGTPASRPSPAPPPPSAARPSTSAPPGNAVLTCTVEVSDETALRQAANSAGPKDVICVRGELARSVVAVPGLVPSSPATPGPAVAPASDAGPPGVGTPEQSGCTKEITDRGGLSQALSGARPGDKICVKVADLGARLEITKGGGQGAPIQIIGTGKTATRGITIKADNVVVDGFVAEGAQAPGISVTGNGITVRNNTITRPTGGDGDGLRFFGNHIAIVHNTIGQTGGCGRCHADCMQTFTSGAPSSQYVRIEANRCEKIANLCLMAEGPGDVGDGGGGNGTSADWTLSNNYCEFGGNQGYMIEAVQNVAVTNNEFTGKGDKAVGLDIGSTGAKVGGNKLNGVRHEVGMDNSSKPGYQGPKPGTGP
ncbi:MAG: right-handed parallel beta-helix repeat-containing protein [Pseudonocardia sp.]|nr:right-handed parallel beta-helix repeat-containing protein [Pseudonocardia sp.]